MQLALSGKKAGFEKIVKMMDEFITTLKNEYLSARAVAESDALPRSFTGAASCGGHGMVSRFCLSTAMRSVPIHAYPREKKVAWRGRDGSRCLFFNAPPMVLAE